LERTWGGHYSQNWFDGNMIIGPLSKKLENFLIASGFSGHGIMHAPATGLALSELVLSGGYQTIDLTRLGVHRVHDNLPYAERGIT
jgi:glycine/D-amino acid oxidase-like deaminating enzyme